MVTGWPRCQGLPSRVVGIPQERPLGQASFHLPSRNNDNNQALFSALFVYIVTQIFIKPIQQMGDEGRERLNN